MAVSTIAAATVLALSLLSFFSAVWLCAYKTQPWWSLACSFFAAAFGSSAFTANAEAGATAGWTAVISYGLANALPFWLLVVLSKKLQDLPKLGDYTIADFVGRRYGSTMYALTTVLSIFFMFIWLTAELTSISLAFSVLSPSFPAYVAPLAITIVTATYAIFAGFNASLFTDRIQAVFTIVLLAAVTISVLCQAGVSQKGLTEASRTPATDMIGAVVLILSTTINQFLDLGSWQRVFSSVSRRDAKFGLITAGAVNFLAQAATTMLGLIGMAAHVEGKIDIPEGETYLSFFVLLITRGSKGLAIVTLLLAVILASSTVDSLENSLVAAFAGLFLKNGISLQWARLLAILLVIPAVLLSTLNQSVLSLFLLSNIFSATIIPPIFLGLSPTLATNLGAICGCFVGILSIFTLGWAFERHFIGALMWPLAPKGFNHWTTMVTFIVVPSIAGITTLGVSHWQSIKYPAIRQAQQELLESLMESNSPAAAKPEPHRQDI